MAKKSNSLEENPFYSCNDKRKSRCLNQTLDKIVEKTCEIEDKEERHKYWNNTGLLTVQGLVLTIIEQYGEKVYIADAVSKAAKAGDIKLVESLAEIAKENNLTHFFGSSLSDPFEKILKNSMGQYKVTDDHLKTIEKLTDIAIYIGAKPDLSDAFWQAISDYEITLHRQDASEELKKGQDNFLEKPDGPKVRYATIEEATKALDAIVDSANRLGVEVDVTRVYEDFSHGEAVYVSYDAEGLKEVTECVSKLGNYKLDLETLNFLFRRRAENQDVQINSDNLFSDYYSSAESLAKCKNFSEVLLDIADTLGVEIDLEKTFIGFVTPDVADYAVKTDAIKTMGKIIEERGIKVNMKSAIMATQEYIPAYLERAGGIEEFYQEEAEKITEFHKDHNLSESKFSKDIEENAGAMADPYSALKELIKLQKAQGFVVPPISKKVQEQMKFKVPEVSEGTSLMH